MFLLSIFLLKEVCETQPDFPEQLVFENIFCRVGTSSKWYHIACCAILVVMVLYLLQLSSRSSRTQNQFAQVFHHGI